MGKMTGKVALVTGANRGIGLGIAMALAGEGADLVITARTASQLSEAADQIKTLGGDVLALAGDVSDVQHIELLFQAIRDRYDRLDLLVNNAAVFDGGSLDELSVEAWDRVMATNLRGPFLCTRAALRMMKGQGGGRIINIGSISAQRVRPQTAAYAVSKHGIRGLSQATALEGREYGVTCCCLHPGNVLVSRRTDTDSPDDDEPMIRVEDLAQVALMMASLPPDVQMLESIVMPRDQLFVGRG